MQETDPSMAAPLHESVATARESAGPESKRLRLRRRTKSGQRLTPRLSLLLRYIEHGFYLSVAGAVSLAGAVLFVHVLYRFVADSGDKDFVDHVLELLDGLLLVFIVVELLHTVRAVLDDKVLSSEPFMVVGIVAAIRRLIVISAEAPKAVGEPRFADLMLEMGLLIAAVTALGVTIAVLRRDRPAGAA